jgi:hypothetical protein
LICEVPARFDVVPTEFALLLITTAPGTIGPAALVCGTLTPVPMVPCPFTTPPPVMLVLSAVLAVPTGPGVGVATATACPEELVWPCAVQSPRPAMPAAMQTKRESFIFDPIPGFYPEATPVQLPTHRIRHPKYALPISLQHYRNVI